MRFNSITAPERLLRNRDGDGRRGLVLRRVGLVFLWVLFATAAQGQVASTSVSKRVVVTKPVTLTHTYAIFLLYQNHLDQAAAAREQGGKDGSWLRDHFQVQLGFSASQFATVRATGLRLELELKDLDSRARTIAQADIAARPPGTRPEPNSKIRDLTQEREDTILREIGSLNQQLGQIAAAKLQSFLTNDFIQTHSNVEPHPRPLLKKIPASSPSTKVPQ
jgi:hypothetical protein